MPSQIIYCSQFSRLSLFNRGGSQAVTKEFFLDHRNIYNKEKAIFDIVRKFSCENIVALLETIEGMVGSTSGGASFRGFTIELFYRSATSPACICLSQLWLTLLIFTSLHYM